MPEKMRDSEVTVSAVASMGAVLKRYPEIGELSPADVVVAPMGNGVAEKLKARNVEAERKSSPGLKR